MLYPPNKYDSMTWARNSEGNHVKIGEETCGAKVVETIYMPANMIWDGRCYVRGYLQDLEFQQFTGIKDIKGKEIYEGDICQFHFGADKPFILPITYSENQAAFVYKDKYDKDKYDEYIVSAKNVKAVGIEVIGNIFQTPELL